MEAAPAAGSLLACLRQVPDPRGAQDDAIICGHAGHHCMRLLCGARGYKAIAQWTRQRERRFGSGWGSSGAHPAPIAIVISLGLASRNVGKRIATVDRNGPGSALPKTPR